jgi:hydroxyquinol 1,2-dioxygenase
VTPDLPGRAAPQATDPDNLGVEHITATVLSQIDAPSPRIGQLAASLISHVHDFIRENHVTRDEWMAGLDFLARVGQWTSETRNEFILMSDTSGCSTLVDALNNAGPANMTPTTVEGPFHSLAPVRQMGEVIATDEQWGQGDWTLMHGRVLDPGGTPVAGARIDIWQADQAGFYDVQGEGMRPGDLRALLTTGADGRYWFRTVKPCSYPVPTDGPGGEWLRATGRQPMRPAHIHARVDAGGYRPLITHVFVAGTPISTSMRPSGCAKGSRSTFRSRTTRRRSRPTACPARTSTSPATWSSSRPTGGQQMTDTALRDCPS